MIRFLRSHILLFVVLPVCAVVPGLVSAQKPEPAATAAASKKQQNRLVVEAEELLERIT